MEERLKYSRVAPQGYKAMSALQDYVDNSGLEPLLLELVKMRASQINGCAYCLDMHSKDARAMGESEQRLYELSAWREAPFYTERERAALLWTEELTLINQGHAPDAVYEEVRQHFGEEELVNLTLAIVAINGWNRFGRLVPDSIQGRHPEKVNEHGNAFCCQCFRRRCSNAMVCASNNGNFTL